MTPPQCNDGTGKPPCAGHTSWEAAFFDLRLVPTLELLKGALYLQMEGLIDSASKTLNALVERMTPEQLSAEYYATAVPDRVREAQGQMPPRAKRPARRGGPPGRFGSKKSKKNKTQDEVLLSECSDDSMLSD